MQLIKLCYIKRFCYLIVHAFLLPKIRICHPPPPPPVRLRITEEALKLSRTNSSKTTLFIYSQK